jgi:hypothetical protein
MGFCIQTADRAKGSATAADERAESPMSILDPTQMTLMRAISGATLRNTVLSNNIANADTPGFQPSDVDFHATLANALEDEPEAMLAENGLELNALTQIANSRVQIMKTAMGLG